MGKAQAMRGAAAAKEGDLQEEASHSHSSAMCRRKSCGGRSGQSERAPRGPGRRGARGDGAGGLEARAPGCSAPSTLQVAAEESPGGPGAPRRAAEADTLPSATRLAQSARSAESFAVTPRPANER